jgi:NAD+ synthase
LNLFSNIQEREMRQIDYQAKIEQIVEFIRAFVKENGFSRLIVGLSGGIDSSLSATLAVKAIGKENVYGVMLPYKKSSPASLDDAQALASWLGIRSEIVEITSFADSYFDIYEPINSVEATGWLVPECAYFMIYQPNMER